MKISHFCGTFYKTAENLVLPKCPVRIYNSIPFLNLVLRVFNILFYSKMVKEK